MGSSVTETITVKDGNGAVIANRPVRITRTGPGSEAETVFKTTNDSGVVKYTFTGNSAGTARIDVAIDGPTSPGTFTFATATDTVKFGANSGGRSKIHPVLTGKSIKHGKDRVRVSAKKANGATIQVYKLINGNPVLLATGKSGSKGIRTFKVKDRNGNANTKYVALVKKTRDTKQGVTNVKKIR